MTLADPEVLFQPDDGYRMRDFASADLDGDGAAELIVLQTRVSRFSAAYQSRIVVLSPDDIGLPRRVGALNSDQPLGRQIIVKDADGDGTHEIATGSISQLFIAEVSFDGVSAVVAEPQSAVAGGFSEFGLNSLDRFDIADLNGDGRIDVMAVDDDLGTVVLLAGADGLVGDPVRYEGVGELVDFTADGLPDLHLLDAFVGSVLVNAGDGTFEGSATWVPNFFYDVLFTDFDLDGKMDLIREARGLELLRGAGDGTFAEPELLLAESNLFENSGYHQIELADFDGDGREDIFVGEEFDVHGSTVAPRVVFPVSDGYEILKFSGAWQFWDSYWTSRTTRLADVDGDGRADFVEQADGGLEVIRQVQPHTLQLTTLSESGTPSLAREVFEFRDDHVDIVSVFSDEISITTKAQAESWQEQTFETGVSLTDVHSVNQVDGPDGSSLVLVLGTGTEGSTIVSLRYSDGTWIKRVTTLPGSVVCDWTTCALQLRDLNGDGFIDATLLVDSDVRSVVTLVNEANELSEPEVVHSYAIVIESNRYYLLTIEDVTGDGLVDILFGNTEAVTQVALNQGEESWVVTTPVQDRKRVDLNGDGLTDFLGGLQANLLQPTGDWEIWTLPDPVDEFELADINGDELPDLLMLDRRRLQFNLGDGTWSTTVLPPRHTWTGAAVDLTGDSIADLVLYDLLARNTRQLKIYSWNGEEWTNELLNDTTYQDPPRVDVLDFDANGLDDLFVYRSVCRDPCNETRVYLGGESRSPQELVLEHDWPRVLLHIDLTGDGRNEIAGFSFNTREDTYFYSFRNGELEIVSQGRLPYGHHLFGISDVDGDGFNDVYGQYSDRYVEEPRALVVFGGPHVRLDDIYTIPGPSPSGDGLIVDHSYFWNAGAAISVSALWRNEASIDWETVMLGSHPDSVYRFADVDGDGLQENLLLAPTGITMVSRRPVGDFDADGSIDDEDIDALFAGINAGTESRFDLNHDLQVDQEDVDFWLDHVASTRRGDANLDGQVDFVDFLEFSGNFGRTDAAWAEGDFNGDRVVDFADYLLLAKDFDIQTS